MNTDLHGDGASTTRPDGSFGYGVSLGCEWLDRLKSCDQKIDDLRARLGNILEVQDCRWTDFAADPLQQRESLTNFASPRHHTNELHLKSTNPCSSTPLPLGQALAESRRPESMNPAQTNPIESPSNRFDLFDPRYSESVNHHQKLLWTHNGENDSGPDDDLKEDSIGNLDPAAYRRLADHLCRQSGNDESSGYDLSFSAKSPPQSRDSDSSSTKQRNDVLADGEDVNLNWLDRLKDCGQMIDDLTTRYKGIMSNEERRWAEFVDNTSQQEYPLSRLFLGRNRNVSSSTPTRLVPTPPPRAEPKTEHSTKPNLANSTANRVALFDADEQCTNFKFRLTNTAGDDEPENDIEE